MKLRYAFNFLIPAFILSLAACNNDNTNKAADSTMADTTGLNAGAKHAVDTAISRSFIELKNMTDMFAINPTPPADAYQIYGNDMSTGLDRMRKAYDSTGDADDAMNQWINPMIRQSDQLKTVTDTSVGRRVFDSIKKQVDMFDQYFDQPQM